jgi:hypothetical protein
LDRIDFQPFSGQFVFVEEKYIDCVDKNYVIGSLRHRVARSGGRLVAKSEDADVILEVRSGSVGTDSTESFIGVPEITVPGMLTLPEVRLLTRSIQAGTAKLGLVAYDAKSMRVLGDGGLSLARSDDNNWYVLGVGPYQNGSIRSEVNRAKYEASARPENKLPTQVAFSRRVDPAVGKERVQLASKVGVEEGGVEAIGVENESDPPAENVFRPSNAE